MTLSKLLPLLIFSLTSLLSAHEPQWIWHTKHAADGEVRFFRKEFTLEALPAKAKLSAACDNEEIVYVNGREVGQPRNGSSRWWPISCQAAPQRDERDRGAGKKS